MVLQQIITYLPTQRGATVAEVNTYHTLKGKSRNHVLLATAIVEVRNKSGQYVPCRALLDSGSQSHFITERCVQRLRLPRTQTHTAIQGISNVNSATHHSVSVHLRSRHTDWHTTLDCAILSNITETTPPTRLDTSGWKIPTDINLADEQFNQPGETDLLIGPDLFYELSRPGRHTRPGNFPVLQETVLGWTTAGRTPANTTVEDVKRAFLQRETSKMEYIIKHFWDVKPVKQSTRIVKHQACEEYLHTHNPTEEGVVVDRHPTKMESIQPGTSCFIAKQGPHTTDRKLKGGPNMKVQDCNFMKEHEEISHKKSVKFQEGNKTFYFLPHQPVSKETSSTTKTRVVFDGGAKTPVECH